MMWAGTCNCSACCQGSQPDHAPLAACLSLLYVTLNVNQSIYLHPLALSAPPSCDQGRVSGPTTRTCISDYLLSCPSLLPLGLSDASPCTLLHSLPLPCPQNCAGMGVRVHNVNMHTWLHPFTHHLAPSFISRPCPLSAGLGVRVHMITMHL